jgi:hypothetical protein
VKPAGDHRNSGAGYAVNQPVLLIDASRVQGRVLVMAQSFGLSDPTERVDLDGV